MVEEPTETAEKEQPDFGAFMAQRVRGYRTGVLGVGSLNDVALTDTSPGRTIIARATDFAESLQSLYSHRTVEASPPPVPVPASPGSVIAREAEAEAEAGRGARSSGGSVGAGNLRQPRVVPAHGRTQANDCAAGGAGCDWPECRPDRSRAWHRARRHLSRDRRGRPTTIERP